VPRPSPERTRTTEAVAGVVLAGGQSSRFGRDKASALLGGRPLLQWVVTALEGVCESIAVVRAAGQALPEIESRVPVRVVEDEYPGKGPLAGLVTGLAATDADLCFAVSCDAPLVRPEIVSWLAVRAGGHDFVCPRVDGVLQPLCAVYRRATCLPVFRDLVERDMLKLVASLEEVDTLIVPEGDVLAVDPDLRSFLNANRPETLAEIQRIVDERS
jgi:molybdopterin-guanine dinucleotide biosynthesis protein A